MKGHSQLIYKVLIPTFGKYSYFQHAEMSQKQGLNFINQLASYVLS